MAAGGNAGVRLRPEDLVVDVDPRNFEEGRNPARELEEELGFRLDDAPTVLTGGGGRHHYFRKDPDVRIVDTLESYKGFEMKSVGRQVVAAGSVHPETGERYLWSELRTDLATRPEAPERLLALFRRAERVATSGGGELSPQRLSACLRLLPAEEFREHDQWLEIMMAAHHGTGGLAREEFLEWSLSDPGYAGARVDVGRRWDSLHRERMDGITVATLFRALLDRGLEIPGSDPSEDFGPVPVDGGATPLERMNSRYACVRIGGAFRVLSQERDPVLGHTAWVASSEQAFRSWFQNVTVPGASGKPRNIAGWWLGHSHRRQYKSAVFDPEREHPGHLNLWTGWRVEPKAGKWDRFRDMIGERLCSGDEECYRYVIRWCAHAFQRPWDLPEVALVLRSEERGTGKGTFARALLEIAGDHGIPISSTHRVVGRFNEHLRDKVIAYFNEAFWAGDHQGEGVLRAMLTERVLSYEGKNAPVVQGRNCIHVVIDGNADWLVPTGLDERRFAVFDVDPGLKRDRAAWRAVNQELEEGGLAAFLHDMLRLDLGDWHPRDSVPTTVALADQKIDSMDDVDRWWLRCLEEGRLPGADPWNGPTVVFIEELADDLRRYLDNVGVRRKGELHRRLGRRLAKLCPEAQRSKAFVDDRPVRADASGRANVYRLPALVDAVNAFERRAGFCPSVPFPRFGSGENGTSSFLTGLDELLS